MTDSATDMSTDTLIEPQTGPAAATAPDLAPDPDPDPQAASADGVEPDTFYLGLTMAGAISAGAYTAGVLDVLFDALDHHNARYRLGKDANWQGDAAGLPRHKVALRVVSGTSAGGVSAGLAMAGLIAARRPDGGDGGQTLQQLLQIGERGDGAFTSASGYSYAYSYILKPLHHVWVEALDLWRKPDAKTKTKAAGFLTLGDLGRGPVVSALNSRHIDEAAAAALAGITWTGASYRFLTEDLDLFLTTTNLQGVPYQVRFSAGENPATHGMAQHATVRHFRIEGLGEVPHRSPWLDAWGDHGIALDLPAPGEEIDFDADHPGNDWRHFKIAAMATGAFPVGLAPRTVEAEMQDFGPVEGAAGARGGAWPINIDPVETGQDGTVRDRRPRAVLGDGMATDPVNYVAVDGGVANNEPFELARYTLRRRTTPEGQPAAPGAPFLKANPRTAQGAHCAVLMIDPFPEGPEYTALTVDQANALRGIVPAARRLVPALINQARFKPGELIEASSADIHSRFLISPSRRESADEAARRGDAPPPVRVNLSGAKAIACGSFGGFGGFFDRAFRAHDYMLGRRNMHSFLANYFNLASSNPVLQRKDGRDDEMVRIVDAGDDFYGDWPPLPDWPRIDQKALEPILEKAELRIREVGAAMVGYTGLDILRQFILGRVWRGLQPLVGGIEASVTKALRSIVMAELIARDQHHDFRADGQGRPYQPWQRDVLVALANAGDRPMPVTLTATEKRHLARDKKPTATLLDAIAGTGDTDESRAHKADELQSFLDDLAARGLIWQAPRRSRRDARYTLTALRPDKVWVDASIAFVSRIGERLRL